MFNNLILYDKELQIKALINQCDLDLKDNIYNDKLRFIEVTYKIFFEIERLSRKNKITFTSDPKKEKSEDLLNKIKLMPLPTKPKKLTPETVLAKAICETELSTTKLKSETKALADGLMGNEISNETLKRQVRALSKAILELSIKNNK